MVAIAKRMLNSIISMPRDKCLQQGRIVCYLLNALHQVYRRADAKKSEKRFTAIKHDISNILLLANMGYEKIAKQCGTESDMRSL